MRERKKTADADPQKHLMLHIFPFWRFIILLQETYSQRKGYNAGLNICGQFRCTCLYIALNEKHSKTQTQFITSSGVHKSILFRARKSKDNRVRNLYFISRSGRKGSHWYIQFVSNGPCGKLKLQLLKSHQSKAFPFYFLPNSLMKWGLSNYCTCVSISPCNNNLLFSLNKVSTGVAAFKILISYKSNGIIDNSHLQ